MWPRNLQAARKGETYIYEVLLSAEVAVLDKAQLQVCRLAKAGRTNLPSWRSGIQDPSESNATLVRGTIATAREHRGLTSQ